MIMHYFANLPASKLALWCYLTWYLCIVTLYFNPDPEIWLNSLGLCIVVGYALFLSTGPGSWLRVKQRFWESLWLFLCPFLVSSFTSLVKGKGFVLLFSPVLSDNLIAVSACMAVIISSKVLAIVQQKNSISKSDTSLIMK